METKYEQLKKHAGGSLLSDNDIRYIRRSKLKPGFLSKMYGRSTQALLAIRKRESYKWVD
jgi:hypothetical protein